MRDIGYHFPDTAAETLNVDSKILLRMKLDPDTVELEEGFTRDTRGIGHYGTGELEVSIKTAEDFQKAKKLIDRAYQETL